MGKPKRLRRGQIVRVEFLDHMEHADDPQRFAVYGELSSITPTSLTVDAWAYADKTLAHDGNEQRFTIVRAAIVKITKLQEC